MRLALGGCRAAAGAGGWAGMRAARGAGGAVVPRRRLAHEGPAGGSQAPPPHWRCPHRGDQCWEGGAAPPLRAVAPPDRLAPAPRHLPAPHPALTAGEEEGVTHGGSVAVACGGRGALSAPSRRRCITPPPLPPDHQRQPAPAIDSPCLVCTSVRGCGKEGAGNARGLRPSTRAAARSIMRSSCARVLLLLLLLLLLSHQHCQVQLSGAALGAGRPRRRWHGLLIASLQAPHLHRDWQAATRRSQHRAHQPAGGQAGRDRRATTRALST